MKCSDSLLDAFQIRNLCIESDRLLRKQLYDLKLLADKEPKIEMTDLQHENEDFIAINQTNNQNSEQVFTKSENEFENFPHFEPSDFLDEDFEEAVETQVKKRSKAKVREPKKVILTKKYKLSDPKMFTEFKSEKPTRQPCPICGRMLTSNYLSHHIKTHSDKPEFWCDHCPLTFKIKGYLVAHLTNIHFTNISKKLVCNICSKRFAKPYLLKEHLAIHDNIRNFPCTRCDKSFFRKFQLEVHFRGHTGSYLFHIQQEISHYIKQFLGERPFICSYCQRGFIHFTDHKRHVMSHVSKNHFQNKDNLLNN